MSPFQALMMSATAFLSTIPCLPIVQIFFDEDESYNSLPPLPSSPRVHNVKFQDGDVTSTLLANVSTSSSSHIRIGCWHFLPCLAKVRANAKLCRSGHGTSSSIDVIGNDPSPLCEMFLVNLSSEGGSSSSSEEDFIPLGQMSSTSGRQNTCAPRVCKKFSTKQNSLFEGDFLDSRRGPLGYASPILRDDFSNPTASFDDDDLIRIFMEMALKEPRVGLFGEALLTSKG